MSNGDDKERGGNEANDAENVAAPKYQKNKSDDTQTAHNEKRAHKEPRSWEMWVAIGSLTFDGIIALAAVVGGILLFDQLEQTRVSNQLTADSNALTRAALQHSIDARKEDAAAAKAAAEEEARRNSVDEARTGAALELTRQQIEESRRYFESTQQARIAVENLVFDRAPSHTETPRIMLVMKNHGASPAERVQIDVIQIMQGSAPVGFRADTNPNPVAPGSLYVGALDVEPITPEQLDSLHGERSTLIFRGTVTYGDAMRPVRESVTFCYRWHPAKEHFDGCTEQEVSETARRRLRPR